jgi:hypothetical protein
MSNKKSKSKNHSYNILDSRSTGSESEEPIHRKKKRHHSEKFDSKHEAPESESEIDSTSETETESDSESESESSSHSKKKSKKMTKENINKLLKKHIEAWIDCDTQIKELNESMKEIKDTKKKNERIVLGIITKMGMEEIKLDITDNKGRVKARVYRHKSVTKGAIKEELLKDTLMEIFHDEKKVDQIVKKVDSKRKINERFYLKRTKGVGNTGKKN